MVEKKQRAEGYDFVFRDGKIIADDALWTLNSGLENAGYEILHKVEDCDVGELLSIWKLERYELPDMPNYIVIVTLEYKILTFFVPTFQELWFDFLPGLVATLNGLLDLQHKFIKDAVLIQQKDKILDSVMLNNQPSKDDWLKFFRL